MFNNYNFTLYDKIIRGLKLLARPILFIMEYFWVNALMIRDWGKSCVPLTRCVWRHGLFTIIMAQLWTKESEICLFL